MRCLTNAAAGLPPALHEGLARVFPNASLFRMYGQTECIRVCYLEPELIDAKPTSIGKAIPGTEAFVLDEGGRPVEPGETGVLHVRGPHIMMGYWRSPELTAEKVQEASDPAARTMSTFDHFTVDEDGDLYFVDRSDDIIKTRGEKVSSVEVENALHDVAGRATGGRGRDPRRAPGRGGSRVRPPRRRGRADRARRDPRVQDEARELHGSRVTSCS